MAIYKSDIVDINLETGSIHRSFIKHTIGTADENADRFGVRVFRNGEAVDLSGCSCYGYFQNSNGDNIALTSAGTVDGNVAYVTLPQACYNYEGNFCLAIKLLISGVTSTVRIVDGVVDNTNTGSAVAPTDAVPSYSEILDQYDAMVAATAVANGAIATTFNAATVYPAGSYVINSGALYRITADHAANVTWANTSKVATNFGAEVTGLKSAIEEDLYYHETDTDAFYWQPKARVNSQGSTYATGSDYTKYAGIKKTSSAFLTVYPGSTIVANEGYTLDYALRQNGTRMQFQRGVAAGTVITIGYKGTLYLSVTDGTTDASTDANAKALAKAGLTIDLITEPIKKTVFANKADIENIKPRLESIEDSLEESEAFVGYVNDYDIVTNVSVGDTVDINSPQSSGTMCYGIIPCEQGDKFSVTGKGLNNPRTWAFTDTEYKLISKSGNSEQATNKILIAESDGYLIVNAIKANPHSVIKKEFSTTVAEDVAELKKQAEQKQDNSNHTKLVSAQKAIAEDWHFSFIDVADGMGLGSNHLIPGTKTIWSQSGTSDLNQKGVWMSDGTHPFKGQGVTDMYARTIAPQLVMVVPSYRDGVGETSPSVWAGRRILWMGTSIPAGSDPDAGEGTGATYPALVSQILGSTSINKAKGSSCVRINASTGQYTGMIFSHFARALSRTEDEVDVIATDWDNIKDKISGAPDELSASNISTMKSHSFESLLLPYLDGTYTMPDLFVIDHGHNDVRPKGIDGQNDLWITPTAQMISDGILAEDTYMTANNYANLKLALNDDLSGISDVASFAATLNRNCFKGAVNFIITVILRYNPYARIAIVSDYN